MNASPHPQLHRLALLSAAVLVGATTGSAAGQAPPVNGMRPADLRAHAIVDAKVVIAPGRTLEKATIVMRDGVIEAVGADVAPPAGARIWSGEGLTVYPGLIEPALMINVENPPTGPGAHWNSRIHAQVEMSSQPGPSDAVRKELRELGFTAAAVYPDSGATRGSGAVIALADDSDELLAYDEQSHLAMAFDYGGRWGSGNYPGSLMGGIALLRQTLHDAKWHEQCRQVYERHPQGNEPPVRADALEALADAINGRQKVLFEVTDEMNAQRAAEIGREFGLDLVLLGSGYEFRAIDDVAALRVPVIVPLDFPEAPKLGSLEQIDRASVREMQTWEQAPTNARRLADAGVTVALTTHRLDKRRGFPGALRSAIRHGLSEDAALAALTTTPAALLGLDHVLGTIEPGKAANLVVVEGSLFDKKGKIRDTWVNGRRYEITAQPLITLKGKGTLTTEQGDELPVELDTKKSSLTLTLADDKKSKAKKVTVQRDQLSFVAEGRAFGQEGYIVFSGLMTEDRVAGNGALPDGDRFAFAIDITEAKEDSDDDEGQEKDETAAADDETDETEAEEAPAGERGRWARRGGRGGPGRGGADEDDDKDFEMPPAALAYPLGAYGVTEAPAPENVLITNATIWTCGPDGIISNGWMLVRDGRIAGIGSGDPIAANGARVIDANGRHVTPGLLDCHSHTGIDGGVNEWAQTNTAEVSIGDVVDPQDINWYRQLAGGLTAANQLHGSANPIGGQNSVVKLKWGGGADDFRIADAKPGIKFALGENVKRSSGRYPDTRMGVETFIRDAFTAARDYQAEWDRYLALPSERRSRTMPPRRDLELDTLVEILDGERLVHCHSYRQDEILMLIRVADDFGFTIGTFQHVLEGYKVADAIAKHGAGASSFSDWWAYKVEVIDAIPYNGALMTDVGVNVSFNSDSSELARRMNTEAAKGVRYGGMDPHEALKLVTINPAWQLRIDHRTGSLERGKDADFVIWSGDPLSTYTICEQTWIEGARYFDLEQDRALRAQVRAERQRLVQKLLAKAHGKPKAEEEEKKSDDAEAKPEAEPTRLLHRMLSEREAWIEEQLRRGRDPFEMQPGDCGCSDHWRLMESQE